MSKTATFNVLFIGYMAQIRKGPEVVCASLDFVSGYATLQADGGAVHVPRIRDLRRFVSSLRRDIDELKKKCGEERCEINVSLGENTLCVQRGADVMQVIDQLAERCSETGEVLRQAFKIGMKIKRRPYSDFIDELKKTGICRVRAYGVGLFVNGKLLFQSKERESLLKPMGNGEYIYLGEGN